MDCVFIPLLRIGKLRMMYVPFFADVTPEDHVSLMLHIHDLKRTTGLADQALRIHVVGSIVPALHFDDLVSFSAFTRLFTIEVNKARVVGTAPDALSAYVAIEGYVLMAMLVLGLLYRLA